MKYNNQTDVGVRKSNMTLPVTLLIAYTHFTGKRWRSYLGIMGIAFGVATYIAISCILNAINITQPERAFAGAIHIQSYTSNTVPLMHEPTAKVMNEFMPQQSSLVSANLPAKIFDVKVNAKVLYFFSENLVKDDARATRASRHNSAGTVGIAYKDLPLWIDSPHLMRTLLSWILIRRALFALAATLAIMFVAGFGLFNIMNVTVYERMKELAILKTMGFSSRDLRNIFYIHTLGIGLVAGILGLIGGYSVAITALYVLSRLTGQAMLSVSCRFADFIVVFLLSIGTSFLAGYSPAGKAAQINPINIIRG